MRFRPIILSLVLFAVGLAFASAPAPRAPQAPSRFSEDLLEGSHPGRSGPIGPAPG